MVRYSQDRTPQEEQGEGTGGLGAGPQKSMEVMPSTMSENALLQNRIYIAFFIDLYREKEKLDS